jgi:3-hydroxyisobutyrate dehydrogenase-like beta-hydroxyacid dehydrogenase
MSAPRSAIESVGFIGLGVMGEPMCRNLVQKSGLAVVGFDLDRAPMERLAARGVGPGLDVADVVGRCDVVMLSLPSGAQVERLASMPGGLLESVRPGQTVVDLGTTPVGLSRDLAAKLADKGCRFADAPVSRTRAAAEAGTLSILVGADDATFETVRPLLDCFAEEVTHCGPVGAGQVVKQLNNMVLAETVVALAEALSVGRQAGLDGRMLFETLAKCSADSFALRNHGLKALVPGEFPERAFSARYMLKDVGYALELAESQGLELRGAKLVAELLDETIRAGAGDEYFPALIKVIEKS